MIVVFVALICCSLGFFLGAAWGSLSMRVRIGRELQRQRLDIAPAIHRTPAIYRRAQS